MRNISVILLFFLICSCDNNSATTNNSTKKSAENDYNSPENFIKREGDRYANMNARAKIVSLEKKTNSNFEEFYIITVQNQSKRTISDLQITYSSGTGERNEISPRYNTFSTSVNLNPGKKTTITTMPAPVIYIIEISKIRYQDGEIVTR